MARHNSIRQEQVADATVIAVAGDLDMHTAGILREEFALSDGAALIVVDLSECDFLDSSGLHALLAARAHYAQTGQELRLATLRPEVLRVLEITEVDRIFGIYPSRASALDGHAPDGGPAAA